MKPIRFTLYYLGQALYKLWQFIWPTIVVFIGWYSVGYLMSRLAVFRDVFDKGTTEWYMSMVLPLYIVSVIWVIFVAFSIILVICVLLWETATSVHKYQPIKRLKDSYRNFK